MGGRPSRADIGASRGPAPVISRDSAVPLHAQFRQYLIELIERGELAPGAQVPRERELAEGFNVSLAPVRQAILDLAKEGYVYRVRGKGTFVRAAKVEERIAILGSFTEAMRAKGLAARLQVLDQELASPPPAIARQLRTRGRVVRIRRRAVVDDQPMAMLEAFLPARRFPGLGSADLEDRSLYAHLAGRYGTVLARAESVIEVGRCDPETALLLALPAGSPLLLVDGVTFDDHDEPVEFSHVLYRADRFRFRLDSVRRSEGVIHLIDAGGGEDTG
jgi:GntR family transcriptional regulator